MSSSTSSSNHEGKVLLVVALVLVAGEVGAHALSRTFSDVQRREQIPETVAQIGEAASPRILFLGNSLTRRGVSLNAFREQLGKHGITVGGAWKVCPDDTTLRHWYYVFERHFAGPPPARSPDYVVVSFVGNALADQVESRTRRLALNVEGARQISHVLRHDLESLDEAGYFLASHWSKAIAHQPEVKDGILRRIVPYYREETERLNWVHHEHRAKTPATDASAAGTAQLTYHGLGQFLDMLKANDCHGVFCLMPLPGEQPLDLRLVETIESAGMTFGDCRGLRVRTQGHYPDEYHMDPTAAGIYSRAVAVALARVLQERPVR